MERITKGMLIRKIEYLAKLGVHVQLDHHQPGDAKYTWAIETKDKPEHLSGRRIWSGRLTAREALICLTGMIEGIEERARQRQFT